ncbi:MAG: FecR family protein [Sphingobacteriaceae bacterium]|nr:FecR family protein [Sphingobacteriaceae bacterium]
MDSNDKIWILMSRSLSGEISAEEESELAALLESHPDLNQQYFMLKKLWNKSFTSANIPEEEKDERALFKKIINKAETERRNATEIFEEKPEPLLIRLFSKRLLFAYAASIAAVLIFFITRPVQNIEQQPEQLITAHNGSRSKILLPDGTTVWLNGGSKIYYDYEFSGPLREVRLDGEAFFDVAKIKDRPFIVHAGKIDIKVHGTAFNVKYYQDDKNIETTLLHGKIEVSDNTNKEKPSIFLVPNQKLIIPAERSVSAKAPSKKAYELLNLDTKLEEKERIEIAWIYNRMEFRGESFEDLARKLERWYNVTITFEDDAVKSLMFNGSFEKETAEQAFSALQKVAAFNFKIQGREIFIKSPDQVTSGIK